MVEAEWDGVALRARGSNRASRVALAGEDHDGGDVVVPAGDIASVRFKGASLLANGSLTVTTVAGRKYQLHFRRKQQDGFEELASALQSLHQP